MRIGSTVLLFLITAVTAAASLGNPDREYTVKNMGVVKDIIVSTQKVRGGTYNFLNGSDFAQFGIYRERRNLKKNFRKVGRKFNHASETIGVDFQQLLDKTRNLNKMAFQLDPLTAFRAYSTLIETMIRNEQRIQRHFFADADPFARQISSLMVADLLPLSEEIGKLRGIGAGAIARSSCEDEEAEMMQASVRAIRSYLDKSLSDLKSLRTRYGSHLPEDFGKRTDELRKKIDDYIAFAEKRIISKEAIDENPNTYFERGTEIITEIMDLYAAGESLLLDRRYADSGRSR